MGLSTHVSDVAFKVSDLVRLAAEHSIGLHIHEVKAEGVDTPVFSGSLLGYEVQPGLTATGGDVTYLIDANIISEAEPCVMCGVLLNGESEKMDVLGYGTVTRERERPAIFGFNRPTNFRLSNLLHHRSRAAGFVLRPLFFERFGDAINGDGLAGLREFATAEFRYALLPRAPVIVDLARRNLDNPYSGHLQELFLESNTLAYVIEVADMLAQEKRMIALMGRRHYDRVMEARDVLDANLVVPPKLLELTKRVGVNLTTLQANFKTVFGTTIFGYVRLQRLQMARVLLQEYRLTVAEAGYKVGFVSPSAFTAAYRRHFGHPPSQDVLRERG